MKNAISFLFVGVCLFSNPSVLFSQSDENISQNSHFPKYGIWVKTRTDKRRVTGYVYEFKESSILLGPIPLKEEKLKEVQVNHIQAFKIRKREKIVKSLAIGAASGLVAGFVTGKLIWGSSKESNHSSHVCDDDASFCFGDLNIPDMSGLNVAASTAFGAIAGGLIGGVIGGIRIKVPIRGKQELYEKEKKRFDF